jgi:3-methylcrotonyl-CoA carboxylase alpha subunit
LAALTQDSVSQSGHAIECRLYAENPAKMFMPSPGKLETLVLPDPTAGVRVDTGVRQGDVVTPYYDPMLAKLICHADSRSAAIDLMQTNLRYTSIEGIANNVSFLKNVMAHRQFQTGDIFTGFIDTYKTDLIG